ncbi:MAG: hypothetical protein F9K32_18835 [Desulfobulbaceae bacterium]|nr:MAG: hypothetical protein F9K32_18835 [Desulfobulbaceae bacterium]
MIKRHIYQALYAGFPWVVIVDFLLFLLQPEDTSATATPAARDVRFSRFDNRFGGAAKIAFWCAMVLLFWIGFGELAATVAMH